MVEAVDLKHGMMMRMLGWVLIVLSIVEFGVGSAAYEFVLKLGLGAFWGAIMTFIVGIVGAISNNKCHVITGVVLSIVALVVVIVALMYDWTAATVIGEETGCYNTQTGRSWGTTDGINAAMSCAFNGTKPLTGYVAERGLSGVDLLHYNYNYNNPNSTNNNFFYNHPNWIYYYNVNHYQNWYQSHNVYSWNQKTNPRRGNNNQCICSDDSWCYGYGLAKGDDCGTILTTFSDLLTASAVFLLLLMVATFFYGCYACRSACSYYSLAVLPVITTVEPVQVQMAGTAVYVQPGLVMGQTQPQHRETYGSSSASAVASQYVAQYAPVASTEGEAVAVGDDKFI